MLAAAVFLILTPREFAPALAPYAQFKSRGGLPTEIVALEDVLADAEAKGADDAETVKRYLHRRWSQQGGGDEALRYVLLVGDADVFPVRYMALDRNTEPAFNYAFYPSDLYFADLAKADGSFEDWNGMRGTPGDAATAFHATYFGEVRGEHFKEDPINFDGIDYRPEVGLGRWPVSTRAEAERMVRKSMGYEQSLSNTNLPMMRATAVFVAVGGWIENRPTMDAWGPYLPAGWGLDKLYWRAEGEVPAPPDAPHPMPNYPPPTEANVVQAMNDGAGLIVHSGHGWDDGWAESLTAGALPNIQNADRLPIMMSAGCSTARFATLPPYEGYVDIYGVEHAGTNNGEVFTGPPPAPACYQRGAHNPSGLGEKLLRSSENGAAAYIGCNTGSQPCGMTLAAGFLATISSSPGARAGDCWKGAVTYYWEQERLADLTPNEDWYPPSIFFQGMKFMFFGDPTLPMPGPAQLEHPVESGR